MASKKYYATVQIAKKHMDSTLYETNGSSMDDALDVLRSCFYTRKNFKFISKHVAFDWYIFSYNSGNVSVEFRPIKKVKKGCGSIINLNKKN